LGFELVDVHAIDFMGPDDVPVDEDEGFVAEELAGGDDDGCKSEHAHEPSSDESSPTVFGNPAEHHNRLGVRQLRRATQAGEPGS
jgi:hypothetical protein